MLKNKSLSLFFFLFIFQACGLNTGGQNLASIDLESMDDIYYQNTNGTLKGYLNRNQDLGNAGKYSRLSLYFEVLKQKPDDISPLPDFEFALRIQEFNTGKPESTSQEEYDDDEEPTILETAILTFGDLSRADQFLIPQEKDALERVAMTNLQRKNNLWVYTPAYTNKIMDTLNLKLSTFLYSINNIYDGCAFACQGSTAILPQMDTKDPRTKEYAIILWVFDSLSPIKNPVDRQYSKLSIDVGYINKKGYFIPQDNKLLSTLYIDFNSKETEYNYKKRIRKEKELLTPEDDTNQTGLNKFFSTLTKNDTETNTQN